MAKKRKKQKAPREFTKHQLSRYQQQQKRQRLVLSVGIAIIAVVVVIVGVGWYASHYRPLHQTAIIVNDTEFDMKYYIDALKFHGRDQSPEYIEYIADSVLNDIEQNELIKQEALRLGISVSDAEVKEKLKSDDLPNDAASRNWVRNRMLIDKLLDEHFEEQVPMSAEQLHIMAMLLESESQAAEVRARVENGESFAELAGEFSLDYATKTNEGDLDWHPESTLTDLLGTAIPVEYASGARAGELSPPLYDEEGAKEVGYWLAKVINREDEEGRAHVHGILLGSEEEAQQVTARLEAGEDFMELAKEISQMPGAEERGGNLDWVNRGDTSPALDEFVFSDETELNKLSEPIRDETMMTKGGYWLVKVLEKDADRQIAEVDRDQLKVKALNEWGNSLWDDPDNLINDSFLDYEKMTWAIEQAKKGLE